MKFIVEGIMKFGKRNKRRFMKEIEAQNEKCAKEKALCILGSAHRLKRCRIEINKIQKMDE